MKIHGRALAAVAVIVLLSGCAQPADDDAQQSASASAIATVRIEAAAATPMTSSVDAYGSVEYSPRFMRTIDASADVVVEQVLAVNGATVEAGQRLLMVRPTPGSALELQRAQQERESAEQGLKRTQYLFSQHLATNADLAAAQQAAASTRAAAASARLRIGPGGAYAVRADGKAVIAAVDVSRGQIVPAGGALVHLADGDRLSVRLGVEMIALAQVKAGQTVTLAPIYDSARVLHGTIAEVIGQLDNQTHLAQALVELAGSAGLLPGAMVRARIQTRRRDAVLGVPRAAVLRDGDQAFVFVVAGNHAKRVVVGTGLDDGTRIEITDGVKAGDRVVVEGNHELEDGMTVALADGAAP